MVTQRARVDPAETREMRAIQISAPSGDHESALIRSLVERVGGLEREFGRLDQRAVQQAGHITRLEGERDALRAELETLRAARWDAPSGTSVDHRGGRWIITIMGQLLALAHISGRLEGELALLDAEVQRATARNRELREVQRALLALSIFAFGIGIAVGVLATYLL